MLGVVDVTTQMHPCSVLSELEASAKEFF